MFILVVHLIMVQLLELDTLKLYVVILLMCSQMLHLRFLKFT